MFGSSTTFPIATLKITIKAAPIAVRTRFWSTQRLAMIIIVWRAYYVNPIISSICASPSCIGIGFTWPISTGARSRSLKILYLYCPRIIESCLKFCIENNFWVLIYYYRQVLDSCCIALGIVLWRCQFDKGYRARKMVPFDKAHSYPHSHLCNEVKYLSLTNVQR